MTYTGGMSRNNNKNGKSSSAVSVHNEDLKNMLMSFRIAELQTLLASCGRSRSGRKHELLGRAVSLLKASFEGSAMRERVKSRILELYHQRYASGGGDISGNATCNTNNGGTEIEKIQASYTPPYIPHANAAEQQTYLNRPNYHKPDASRTTTNGYSTQPMDTRIYETRMVQPPTAPVHPDVRFISLPFFEVVDILMKPTSLVQKTMIGCQDTSIVYHLTPYQTQLITNSRSYHVKSMIEYAVQVQLRFCLAETSCVQEDLYPTHCKIIVNGKSCTLPGQPPPNAQNQEPRKPHRPVNITSFCRLSPMQSNQIQIQWMPNDLGQRYAATVHLVKIVQVDTLLQQLTNKPERSKALSIAFIKEKLSSDPDSEIAMTSLKVSLCCPIGRSRMTMPCRGTNCKHLQCFDGATYIQMNERKPSWVCPVCDQKAYYDDLFKDGLFTSIINEATSCDDIVFYEDGSWRPLSDDQPGQDGSKPPIAELLNTPKSNKQQKDSETPPVLSINTPPSNTVLTPLPTPTPVNIPPMPRLEAIPSTVTQNGNANNNEDGDEEVEVIMIDDSDDDDDDTVPDKSNPPPSNVNGQRYISSQGTLSQSSSASLPFSDPELHGIELYNLLPHEDRIAAAMHLDQNGILNQLANVNNSTKNKSRPLPPTNIIDISDE